MGDTCVGSRFTDTSTLRPCLAPDFFAKGRSKPVTRLLCSFLLLRGFFSLDVTHGFPWTPSDLSEPHWNLKDEEVFFLLSFSMITRQYFPMYPLRRGAFSGGFAVPALVRYDEWIGVPASLFCLKSFYPGIPGYIFLRPFYLSRRF